VDEHELGAAARLQRALLPPPFVSRHGWSAAYRFSPAGPVGGDILDLIPSGDRMYFLLADVSGKGIAASMLTGYIHATFRSLVPLGMPLEDMVRRASALLCASTLPSQYATLVFGSLAPDGAVSIINAGHPPPLVVGGAAEASVVPTGAAAGLFCDSVFGSTSLRLQPGEALLLYSDGLTEAFNDREEEYGIERLRAASGRTNGGDSARLLMSIAEDHAAFLRQRAPGDDLTVLALARS
jgi:phosphoserine phosphatase RsbU/P